MIKNPQPLQVLKKTAIAAAVLMMCSGVQAQTNIYTFGTQISSLWQTTFQPAGAFAALAVTSTDSMHYVFDLQVASNFGTLFGSPDARIGAVAFNTSNVEPVAGSVHLLAGTNGVSNVWYSLSDVTLGGIAFDFTEGWYASTSANANLTSGERAVWEASFAAPTGFLAPPFAVKVFGIGGNASAQAWYVPSSVMPIPEPETYAMLLVGLGMLGFAARRRKQKEAAAV